MRKLLFIGVFLAAVFFPSFADTQFRLAGDFAADFSESPSLETVRGVFGAERTFYGFHWELILDHVGFGMHYFGRFDRVPEDVAPLRYDWSMDWDSDLFLSYHLFGGGAMIDPFVEVGYGLAGKIDTDQTPGYWEKDNDRWYYVYSNNEQPSDGALSSMSLYPFLAGGLSLDLHGFLLGTKLGYRAASSPIPSIQVAEYPLDRFQLAIFGGFAIGGHR